MYSGRAGGTTKVAKVLAFASLGINSMYAWYFHLAGIVITSLTQAIGLHLLSGKFLDHVPVFGMVT